jgi:hypothetical protein
MVDQVRREVLKVREEAWIDLKIKLHPLESKFDWQTLAPDVEETFFLPGSTSLERALEIADVVGSFYSTVLIEALLWTKPIFQLNPFTDTVPNLCTRGGIVLVGSAAELSDHLRRMRSSPTSRRRMVTEQVGASQHYFSNVGSAVDATWGALERLRT